MIASIKKQQGLTLITIVFILAICSFFVLLGLKIGPIYMNHSKVLNSMAAVEAMEDVSRLSKREIYSSFEKRFSMNYVDKVDNKDIKITKNGEYLKVEIEYERIEEIYGNLSVLIEFYDFFEVGDSE